MIRLGALLPSPDLARTARVHFLGIACTLAAAKVLLETLAAGLFFAREGPDQLPLFYVSFAALAVAISAGLAMVVDALRPFVLIRATMLAALVIALGLRLAIGLEVPGVYFLLLAAAHAYDIVSDIVFWVAAAAYFTSRELKRHSATFFLVWAAGGALGGVLANNLLGFMAPEDLLFAFMALACLALLQLGLAGRRGGGPAAPSGDGGPEDRLVASLRALPGLIAGYPYVLLLACTATMLMLVYCLCEYLWATVYVLAFPDEATLTAFVARVYVTIQVLQFGVLMVISQPFLERSGPLVRNLVFPITSLGCLIAFALSPKLPAAVAVHINSEAISNAIFEPANNANYVAIPQRYHGRVRTLVDGVFYPGGMAVGGLVLAWVAGSGTSLAQVTFVALFMALVFAVLNLGLGSLFLPTLVRSLRSGIVHVADVAAKVRPPKLSASELHQFLQAADASARAIGFIARQRQGDATSAAGTERATRNQLVGLLHTMPERHAAEVVGRLLNEREIGLQLVALQYRLGRPLASDRARLHDLARSSRSAVSVLTRLVVAGRDRPLIARFCEELRASPSIDAECRSVLIDAVAIAGRPELAAVLGALLEAEPPPEEVREALAALGRVATGGAPGVEASARRFVDHRDDRIRAAAAAALVALRPPSADPATAAKVLADPSPAVRRQATAALARHGDAAVKLAAMRLLDPDVGVVRVAVRTLGAIRSRRAQRALGVFLEDKSRLGVRRLAWLAELPAGRGGELWQPLRFGLEESNRRTLDLALEALAALGGKRVVQIVRRALESGDRRRCADAVEILLALPHRDLVTAVLPLLEALGEPTEPHTANRARLTPAEIAAAAARDSDPWVRALARRATGAVYQERSAGGGLTPRDRSPAGPIAEVTEAEVDRVLLLKSLPLFTSLPLATLIAVAEVLVPRRGAAGATIHAAGTPMTELLVLESGVLALRKGRREVGRLAAPAILGEPALVDDDAMWPHEVTAVEPCSLLAMHQTVFKDLAHDHPDILVELSRLLARRREERVGESATPSIAVVPFANMSGALDQEYFADGIAEDIITELSRYRWFLVIARDSSFTFKGRAENPTHVARALGVRYVLTGSVRRAGARVRITAQLVDATAGHQVWAERYDRELGDIFAVQDEITTSIVAAVAPHFLSAETRRAQRKDVADLDTWEYVMRARWHHARCTARDCVETHALLAKALELDPMSAGAHCLSAFTHLAEIQFGWVDSPEASLAAAARAARSAVHLDGHDATAHAALGLVDLMSRRYQDAVARFTRAIELNPNLAIAQGGLGQAYALAGDYEPAVVQIQKAIRLSPEDPFMVYWFGHLGLAAFAAGRYAEAASWGAKAVEQNPDSPAGHRLLATSLAHLGRVEEARDALQEVLRRIPGMAAADVRRQVPFKKMEDIERYVEGLHRAGLRR